MLAEEVVQIGRQLKRKGFMKQVLYKKRQSLKNRRKMIRLSERSEDKDCKTHVCKNFVYLVQRVSFIEGGMVLPQVYIKKSYDSKQKMERFSFRVKGSFYIRRDRVLLKVHFCHSLRIQIYWKSKEMAPKKTAPLT